MKEKSDFTRVFEHALEFYSKRINMIIFFSIPFFLAFLIPLLVPGPTYMSLGGVFIRGGSIPTMQWSDWVIAIAAYAISLFIIADSMVNINLLIKSKRTLTNTSTEVINAMEKYAIKVFLISIILSLIIYAVFLILYDNPMQNFLYPLVSLFISLIFFFSVPAVVIDERDTLHALFASTAVVVRKPFFVLSWIVVAIVLFVIAGLLAYALPSSITQYLLMLLNSIIILPFLLVLTTQMYMEKYPLAK